MKQSIPFKKDIIFKTKIAEITSISLEHTLSLEEDIITGDFIISGDYKMTEASINKEEFYYKLPFDIALDSRYNLKDLKLDIEDFYYEIINSDILRVNIEVSIDGLKEKDDYGRENIEIIKEEKEEEFELEIANQNIVDLENEIKELKEELNRNANKQDININDNDKINYEVEDNDKINIEIGDKDIDINPNFEVLNNNNESSKDNELVDKIPLMNELEKKSSNIDSNKIKSLFNNFSEEESFDTYRIYIMREDDTVDSILSKYGLTKDVLKEYNDIDNIKIGDKIIIPSLINDK